MDKHTPGTWFVRTRNVNGEIKDCFVAAPPTNGMPYDAEVLGDDEYREDDGMVRKLADCHLIAAAKSLLAYYRASKNLQMTLGHPDATVQEENEVEAAYEAASSAAADAVGALVLHNLLSTSRSLPPAGRTAYQWQFRIAIYGNVFARRKLCA